MLFKPVFLLLIALCLSASAAMAQAAGDETEPRYPDGAYALALGDYEAARDLFSEECQAGDTESCLSAADAFRIGRGGPQDYARAIGYATQACDRFNTDGCTVVATIHFEGRQTGEPNYEAARVFYGRACERSDPRGCAGLGNMQYIGLGGARDRRQGIANLRQACAQDFDYACSQLDRYGQNR